MIKELMKIHINAELKKEGFKKKELTWNRNRGNITHVINIQKGRIRIDGSLDFTLNLGVWIQEIWEICWGKSAPKFIHEEHCFPRLRIALLLNQFHPNCKDKWWILSNKSDNTTVGLEIKNIITEKCLPFFQRFNSLDDVEHFVDSSIRIRFPLEELYYAILKKLSGDDNTYKNLIKKVEGDTHWRNRAEEIKRRIQMRCC